MNEEILCPYCGGKMTIWTEYQVPKPKYYTSNCVCNDCGATSPKRVAITMERAKEMAAEAACRFSDKVIKA